MNENPQDTLLEELKNLSKTIRTEIKNEKAQETVSKPEPDINDSTISSTVTVTTAVSTLTEDNLSEYVLSKSKELLDNSLETVKDLQASVIGTLDTRTMLAYSELVKATTGALSVLNDLNMEKKKQASAKEIKQMDIDSKKQLLETKKPTTVNNLIASRDDILKMLTGKDVDKVIDAEFSEIKEVQ